MFYVNELFLLRRKAGFFLIWFIDLLGFDVFLVSCLFGYMIYFFYRFSFFLIESLLLRLNNLKKEKKEWNGKSEKGMFRVIEFFVF